MFKRKFKIPNHKTLHPKLWLANEQMRPEVWEILNRITVSMMSLMSVYTHVPMDIEHDIVDVIVCGSCAEYFYTKGSDLDLKIIIRTDRYLKNMDEETYIEFSKMLRSLFVEKYQPHIAGIKIDIGLTITKFDMMPCYSIKTNQWLYKPCRLTNDELEYLESRANIYYRTMVRMIKRAIKIKTKDNQAAQLSGTFKTRRNKTWDEKWLNKGPFCFAYSRLSKEPLLNKINKISENNTRRLLLDIKMDPS